MHDGGVRLGILIDCDNTLFDNDQFAADVSAYLERELGVAVRERYWGALEAIHQELGYDDYLGALERCWRADGADSRLLLLTAFLLDYPFAERLYPGALETIERLRASGPAVILSDGDVVFQSRKIQRAGLWDAVGGRVLIYRHKERMLDVVARAVPAEHYVMVDDKLRILAAMKAHWGDRLTTIAVHQGHYATDAASAALYPPADLSIAHIRDLAGEDLTAVLGAGSGRR